MTLLPHAAVMEHAKRMVRVNAPMDSTEIPVQVNFYHLAKYIVKKILDDFILNQPK